MVQGHEPALDPGLAAVLEAVPVQIVELDHRDHPGPRWGGRLGGRGHGPGWGLTLGDRRRRARQAQVAEVPVIPRRLTVRDHQIVHPCVVGREGLFPPGRHHLVNPVMALCQAGKRVPTVRIRQDTSDWEPVRSILLLHLQVDRPSRECWLAAIPLVVAVKVVPLRTRDRTGASRGRRFRGHGPGWGLTLGDRPGRFYCRFGHRWFNRCLAYRRFDCRFGHCWFNRGLAYCRFDCRFGHRWFNRCLAYCRFDRRRGCCRGGGREAQISKVLARP